MKKIILLLVLASSPAFAGKLLFDARLDGQGQTFNNEASSATLGHDNFRFMMKTARLDYQGNLNDKTNVRARAILNTTQGAVQTRDNLNGTVDLFFVNHKVQDNLELTAGKFSSDIGGWEHQLSSPDVYLFSAAYSGGSSDLNTTTRTLFAGRTGATIGTFTWASTGTTRYYTGAKLTHKVEGHELAIHTADLTADDNVGTTSSQTRTLTGLVYKGSFSDKLIQPLLSYHEGFLPGGGSDAKVIFANAGLRFNFDDNVIDLDYLTNTFKSRTAVSTGGFKDDAIRSTLLAWSKVYGQWTPKVKLESSEMLAADQKIFDVKGYSVALEYRPEVEENFRYHVAYNAKEYAPITGSSLTMQEVVVGTRIAADILK
ncbi:MAG: porin [Bdellovibrionota bacterium]